MDFKKITGFDYLRCALYVCAAFAFEFLLVYIEGIWGIDINHSTDIQMLIHWLIIITLWLFSGAAVIKIAKNTTGFDIFEHQEKLKGWQYIAIVICFILNIWAKYLDWNGFKVFLEWKARGPFLFLFQYLYYIAEGFLISQVIVYGSIGVRKMV